MGEPVNTNVMTGQWGQNQMYPSVQYINQPPVTEQPVRVIEIPAGTRLGRKWSTGLFDCCADPLECLFVYFCFCCHSVRLAKDMGESSCVPFCVSGWLVTLRAIMRTRENIAGSVMDDANKVCWCPLCVQCQLAREVKICNQRAMSNMAMKREV